MDGGKLTLKVLYFSGVNRENSVFFPQAWKMVLPSFFFVPAGNGLDNRPYQQRFSSKKDVSTTNMSFAARKHRAASRSIPSLCHEYMTKFIRSSTLARINNFNYKKCKKEEEGEAI